MRLSEQAPWAPPFVLATLWLGAFALALFHRLPYPYDLEWMEGGMLAHTLQLPDLYGPPRLDFVPFVYPPGYPALLAVLGPSPFTGRLLSLMGSLLAAASLGSMLRDRRLGFFSAVCFLGTWSAGGAFFDLVRPDGLALGLLALGIALTWHSRSGVVPLVLAFFFKQSTAFFLPALWLGVAARDGWRAGARLALFTGLPVLIGLAALHVYSGGYASIYLFEVPSSHPLVYARLFPLAWLELGAALPVLSATAAALLLFHAPGRTPIQLGLPLAVGIALSTSAALLTDQPDLLSGLGLGALGAVGMHLLLQLRAGSWQLRFLAALCFSALIAAVWMRAHHGGFVNVLLPAFWVLALGAGMVLQRWPRFAAGAVTVQLAALLWSTPFTALTPTRADRRAGDALVERLKQVEGPVWSPYAVWLPTYAGHAPQSHLIAVWDLDHTEGPLYGEIKTFSDALRRKHWGAVVTSQRQLGFGLQQHYRLRTQLHTPKGALEPKSGWRVRLDAIWTPKGG